MTDNNKSVKDIINEFNNKIEITDNDDDKHDIKDNIIEKANNDNNEADIKDDNVETANNDNNEDDIKDNIIEKANNDNNDADKSNKTKAKPKAKPKTKLKNDEHNKVDNTKSKAKAKNDNNFNGIVQMLHEYFDKKIENLEVNNKIIDISKNDIINYQEQIIKVKRGQRLIIQMI